MPTDAASATVLHLPTASQRSGDPAWTALFAAYRETAEREHWAGERTWSDEWAASRFGAWAGVTPHQVREVHVGRYLESGTGGERSVTFAALRRVFGLAVSLGHMDAHQLPVTLAPERQVGGATAAAYRAEGWRQLLDSFTKTSTSAEATRDTQLHQTRAFARWAGDVGLDQVDVPLLKAYFATFEWAPTTRRMARARLRTVFDHAVQLGLMTGNPAAALYTPAQRKPLSSRAPEAWRELLAAFEDASDGHESSVYSHVMRVKTFARWAGEHHGPADVDAQLIARYLDRPSWAKATSNAARVSIRAVFAFATSAGFLTRNPAEAFLVLPTAAATPATSLGTAGPHIDGRIRLNAAAQGAHPARAWARATGRPVSRTGALSVDLIAAWEAAGHPVVADGPEHMLAWTELLADFELTQRARGMADSSIAVRKSQVLAFARWCAVEPRAVDESVLVQFLANSEWKQQTRRSNRSALVSVFRHAARNGWTDHNPAADLDPVRVPAGVPKPAPEEVIREAVTTDNLRLRLMVTLGAQDGLRRAEIAVVAVEDFTDEGLRVHGKGGKVRLVPAHHELLAVRDEYLAATGITAGYLFPGRTRGHLSPGQVGKLVTRALEGPWTTHTLRHRFNTRAFAATKDLRAVQELAGHSSPSTTAGYVAVVSADLVRAVEGVPAVLPKTDVDVDQEPAEPDGSC